MSCQNKPYLVSGDTDLYGDPDHNEIAAKWSDVHRYSPAPRHRRRLAIKILNQLAFNTWLDVGCAQPFLIEEFPKRKNVIISGCDISEKVVASNKNIFPGIDFFVMDVSKPLTHTSRQYDLVTCSEVLEHVENWQAAAKNIAQLCRKWLLITVPSGKVYPIDRRVGHCRHFSGEELLDVFEELGFTSACILKWGFPIHSIYKYAINTFFSDKMYASFGEGHYGAGKKIFAEIVYRIFFINDLFNYGSQLIVLLEKRQDKD